MWVKLDDGFVEHPAIAELSDGAFRLLVASFCYCGRTLNDGRFPTRFWRSFLPGSQPRHMRELVAAGRWIEDGDHIIVRSFLEFNPTAEQVKRDREAAAERQRKRRSHAVTHAVTTPVTHGVSHTTPTRPVPVATSSTDASSRPAATPDDDRTLVARARAARLGRTNPAWITTTARNLDPAKVAALIAAGLDANQIDLELDRTTPPDPPRGDLHRMATLAAPPCPACDGTGHVLDPHDRASTCPTCHGTRTHPEPAA